MASTRVQSPESRIQIDSQSTNWHQTDRTVSARHRPSPRANDLPDLQLPCLFNVAQKECTACEVQCSCALVKQSHVKAWPCIYIYSHSSVSVRMLLLPLGLTAPVTGGCDQAAPEPPKTPKSRQQPEALQTTKEPPIGGTCLAQTATRMMMMMMMMLKGDGVRGRKWLQMSKMERTLS